MTGVLAVAVVAAVAGVLVACRWALNTSTDGAAAARQAATQQFEIADRYAERLVTVVTETVKALNPPPTQRDREPWGAGVGEYEFDATDPTDLTVRVPEAPVEFVPEWNTDPGPGVDQGAAS